MSRTLSPLGRRRVDVAECGVTGAYTVLTVEDPGGPRPDPGQFYMLATVERWGGGEDERPFLPRAFSHLAARGGHLGDGAPEWLARSGLAARAASASGEPLTLDFLLHEVGPGTIRLAESFASDELWLLGPLGQGFAPPRQGRRPILVGGGVGIAPLATLRDELGAAALTLLGFRDAAHAAAAQYLPGARVATDDGSTGHRGFVTDLLRAELGCDPRAEVYACGPHAMLDAVRGICAEHGVPAQLAMEAGMACGYGACFGCVVETVEGYSRLCVDGPVLDAAVLA
jgi:NAD(P)H-flavin reductase